MRRRVFLPLVAPQLGEVVVPVLGTAADREGMQQMFDLHQQLVHGNVGEAARENAAVIALASGLSERLERKWADLITDAVVRGYVLGVMEASQPIGRDYRPGHANSYYWSLLAAMTVGLSELGEPVASVVSFAIEAAYFHVHSGMPPELLLQRFDADAARMGHRIGLAPSRSD